MPRRLTATIRATYEGHKNADYASAEARKDIKTLHRDELATKSCFKVRTPEQYVKMMSIDDEIALGTFLEKIITLGSTKGFVAFMMLYQYMYDNNLLGQEVNKITGQEIIDHIYQENSYKLKRKDKQTLLCSLMQLSGLQFYIENWEMTQQIRQERGFEKDTGYKHFTLLKIGGHTKGPDNETVTSVRQVSIMKDFINIWYKKLSRLFIPLEDILRIPNDHNGDHQRGFNLSLALRHAELGSKKNYVEWTLEQCLNVGQWKVAPRRKAEAWHQIIESLEAGKLQGLIEYHISYRANYPSQPRFIEKVIIYRLWQTGTQRLNLQFKPEEIKPKKRRALKTAWD